MHLWILIQVIWFLFLGCIWAENLRVQSRGLEYIYFSYDHRIRPEGKDGNGPVAVELDTDIHGISVLDDDKMVYEVHLTLRQKWRDARCRYNSHYNGYITLTDLDNIWTPSLSFTNEMTEKFYSIPAPNNFIRIYGEGDILSSTRVFVKLFCPMDLRNFPMDKQKCSIKMTSYAYTTDDVVFLWKSMEPVQVSNKLLLPTFTLSRFGTDYCDGNSVTGNYSCMVINLEFERNFTPYLMHVFIPTILLVMASWTTFWLKSRFTTPPLCIWAGVLLCMITVTTFLTETGPLVPYIKAIDVWIWTCICFIFCVLIETGLVYNAVTKENRKSEEKAFLKADKSITMKDGIQNELTNYSATPLKWLQKYSTQANKIDVMSRILFPTMFGIFNLVYWLTYTPMKDF